MIGVQHPNPLVKICGITNIDDALFSARAGADFIGLNVWPGSPRGIEISAAQKITDELRKSTNVKVVAVTVSPTEDTLAQIAEFNPDFIQIHGECRASKFRDIPVLRAFSIGSREDLNMLGEWVHAPILLDAKVQGLYGGTGTSIDPALLEGITREYFLAGGLNAANVAAAVKRLHPFAVDVASGVESAPGKKNHGSVTRFINEAKAGG